MKINDDILKELASIAPILASLNKQNCFAVPKGYFVDGLPQSFTLNDLKVAGLVTADKSNAFTKPIEDDVDLTYLNVISEIIIEPYQYLKEDPLYILPEHYFDILPTLIMNEINGEVLLPNQLNQNTHHTQYKIPKNYFNELPQNILQTIKKENIEESVELNALFKQMQHEAVYQIPQNYFATLSDKVLNQVNKTPVETGKRIILKPAKKPLKRVLALAAMLTLFVAGFWLIQTNQSTGFDTTAQIAQLSNQDIKDYISENSFNFNESNLLEATGKVENDLFLNIDIQQEDIDFYLNDLDVNFINDYYSNESTFDI